MNSRYCLIIVFILLIQVVYGQSKLHEAPRYSEYGYIYKLTEKSADKVIDKGLSVLDTSDFDQYTLRYSDRDSLRFLHPGNYVSLRMDSSRLEMEFLSVKNVLISVINNQQDFIVTVMDSAGNYCADAEVKVGLKFIKWDEELQAFRLKKSYKKGTLKIKHKGVTNYFQLKAYNTSKFLAYSNKIIYRRPLRYVTLPIRNTVMLPLDIYKLIRFRETHGFVWKVYKPIRDISRWINVLYDEPRWVSRFACRWFKGKDWDMNCHYDEVVLFDKPKYRPGDTVHYKAFFRDERHKSFNKALEVWVRKKKLGVVQPLRNGVYAGEFVLNDSLNLKLDQDIYVGFYYKDARLIHDSFKYEDYELPLMTYEFEIDQNELVEGDSLRITARAENDQGVAISGTTVDLSIFLNRYERDIPESLSDKVLRWKKKYELDNGELKLALPDTLWAQSPTSYRVEAKLCNSFGDCEDFSERFIYHPGKKEFRMDLKKDTLYIDYFVNNQLDSGTGDLEVQQVISGDIEYAMMKWDVKEITTPFKMWVDPRMIKASIEKEMVDFSREGTGVSPLLERDEHAIRLSFTNERNIDYRCIIYKNGEEKVAYNGKELSFEDKCSKRDNYDIYLECLWGGEVLENDYQSAFNKYDLDVQMDLLDEVRPGDQDTVSIRVTDVFGKPVSNLDLTLWANKESMKHEPRFDFPKTDYRTKNGRKIYNHFSLEHEKVNKRSFLAGGEWPKLLSELSENEFYQFIYPKEELEVFKICEEKEGASFAFWVLDDGVPERILYATVDQVPVYISMAENKSPYTFEVEPGLHSLEVRTNKARYSLKEVYMDQGTHTIFSINGDDKLHRKSVFREEASSVLEPYDMGVLKKYMISLDSSFGEDVWIFNQGKLSKLKLRRSPALVGPLVGGEFEIYTDKKKGKRYKLRPGYAWSLDDDALVLRPLSIYQWSRKQLFRFQETPYTMMDVRNDVVANPCLHFIETDYFEEHLSRSAMLACKLIGEHHIVDKICSIELWRESDSAMMKILNPRDPDFVRIPAGIYHFIVKTKDGIQLKGETFELQKGHIFQYAFEISTEEFIQATLEHHNEEVIAKVVSGHVSGRNRSLPSVTIYSQNNKSEVYTDWNGKFAYSCTSFPDTLIISKRGFLPEKLIVDDEDFRWISLDRDDSLRLTGAYSWIEGKVLDVATGEPIFGANVLIKGTTLSTMTDMDGFFELEVPKGYDVIEVFSIGYVSEYLLLTNEDHYDILLNEAIVAVAEVAVTGVGIKGAVKRLGYSVIEMRGSRSVNALSGKVAGVNIVTSWNGPPTLINKTAISSLEAVKDLVVIVDGVPVEGPKVLDSLVIKDVQYLNSETLGELYGCFSGKEIMLVTTKEKLPEDLSEWILPHIQEGKKALVGGKIRESFQDAAFWHADLVTDKNGEAKVVVKYPDDATTWKVQLLATDWEKYGAHIDQEVRAILPLQADVASPRFWVEGDSLVLKARVDNFTEDPMAVKTHFKINGTSQAGSDLLMQKSLEDSISVIANSDSLDIIYQVKTQDGFTDGERNHMAINPRGLYKSEGTFYSLSDTTWSKKTEHNSLLTISSRESEILLQEISYLGQYKHLCNEQLASKLMGVLWEQKLVESAGEKWKKKRKVQKMIRQLEERENKTGGWGWWPGMDSELWVSSHVAKALTLAEKMKYDVHSLDQYEFKILGQLNAVQPEKVLDYLILLAEMGNKNPERLNVVKLDDKEKRESRLRYEYFRSLTGLEVDTSWVLAQLDTNYYGEVYAKGRLRFHGNTDFGTTVHVYGILKNLNIYPELRTAIRQYFYANRQEGYWVNTYWSSNLLNMIGDDVLKVRKDKKRKEELTLYINGKLHEIKGEHFKIEVNAGDDLRLSASASERLYLSLTNQVFDTKPERNDQYFELQTEFKETDTLKVGERVILRATVNVKHEAEWVMIQVPIPSACSYDGELFGSFYGLTYVSNGPDHKEKHRTHASFYFKQMSPGKYFFEIPLRVKFAGASTLNPAYVEMMYLPLTNGNNEVKRVEIQP